jgi:hypothetical protein
VRLDPGPGAGCSATRPHVRHVMWRPTAPRGTSPHGIPNPSDAPSSHAPCALCCHVQAAQPSAYDHCAVIDAAYDWRLQWTIDQIAGTAWFHMSATTPTGFAALGLYDPAAPVFDAQSGHPSAGGALTDLWVLSSLAAGGGVLVDGWMRNTTCVPPRLALRPAHPSRRCAPSQATARTITAHCAACARYSRLTGACATRRRA